MLHTTSCITHLAGRTKVLAWFLLLLTNGGYRRTPNSPNDAIHEERCSQLI